MHFNPKKFDLIKTANKSAALLIGLNMTVFKNQSNNDELSVNGEIIL